MSELKAKDLKDCPWGHPARGITIEHSSIQAVACSDKECGLYEAWMTPDQWNNRPRERELEAVLTTLADKLEYEFRQDSLYARAAHEPAPKPSEPLVFARQAINAVLGKGGE